MNKREARIILPAAVPAEIVKGAEERIIQLFGGFTITNGFGAWNGENGCVSEDIHIYDIAVDATADSAVKLRDLAAWVRDNGAQECVYLRQWDGAVNFI